MDVADIDAIVVATSTPDLTFPSAATMVQAELEMTHGFAFDIQAVCAGFIFALANANALILSGQAKRVLVIGAETFSRIMDWTDRGTCVLFGDGAGALILEAQNGTGTNEDRGVLSADLNSDGRHKDILYVDGGVSTQTTGHLRMQGKEVFRHAVEKLAATAKTAMAKIGITGDDVDWVVPHQANIRIIQGTAKKLGLPMDRVVVTVQDHGNTSAASIPLALSVGKANGQIKKGDLIVTEAIGGAEDSGVVEASSDKDVIKSPEVIEAEQVSEAPAVVPFKPVAVEETEEAPESNDETAETEPTTEHVAEPDASLFDTVDTKETPDVQTQSDERDDTAGEDASADPVDETEDEQLSVTDGHDESELLADDKKEEDAPAAVLPSFLKPPTKPAEEVVAKDTDATEDTQTDSDTSEA
ncbi:3-oxoacyl-[acyl-carrier-protein] synthase 3 [Nymphon striatum]|nr:3-oxoacyl-[acyl-carrier-protein] synthase 3 [Nymphon striatum]